MLSVLRVHLRSDIPIIGCELTPYVLLQCPDTSITTDDVPESSAINGFSLRYRWCFLDAWQHHRTLHERASSVVNENGTEEEELFGRFNTSGSGASNVSLSGSTPKKKLPIGHANTILTSHVIPPPTPSPRHLVPVTGVDVMGNLDLDARTFRNLYCAFIQYSVRCDNVALIVVLEAKFSNHGADTPGKRQLLCVVSI
ncbi:hypothetical protein IFM89_015550 [Coptis chinensis]|uniref:Uncharacterized protein n=1 Tax=Coptis chinensis TaxID=261450 RepID=A0A835HYK7_9MAGN|nr:hypothetical protein IFM89_015550 [Coptis chinensis]